METFRRVHHIASLLLALACTGLHAQVTGTWAGTGTSRSATAGLVTITASASGPVTLGSDILGCPGAYSTSAVDLAPSLLVNYADFTQTGTLTFTFSSPVKDPILHLDRIGGNQLLLATSGMLTIQTPSVTWTGLSANGTHFNVAPTTVYRTPSLLCASGQECGAALSIVLGGPASGSLRINGTISSLTLSCTQAPGIPLGNPGDVFEIAFSAIPQPPVAGDDAFALNEDGSLSGSVTGNDTDADNTPAQLSWSLVSGGTAAANGALVFNANGTFSFTPNANVNGVFSFAYSVCDPNGACDQATVTLTVNSVNDQPIAQDDAFNMIEDGSLNASVGTNDSDVETPSASLAWSLVNAGTAGANGSLAVHPNGTFSYAPNEDVTGTFTFLYQVCDGAGSCDQATATITVTPVNDPPTAVTDVFHMNEDAVLASSVAGNDDDVDGDALTWSLLSGGSATTHGTLQVDADGSFSYAPSADFTGAVIFTYTVCDPASVCSNANVTIIVDPVNDAPTAGDDDFTVSEDAVLNASVVANDGDSDDPWSLGWSLLAGGTAAANGTLAFNADGSFSYAPHADLNGTVGFTYRLCDGEMACDPAGVTIHVTPVNDAPMANDDAFATSEDVPLLTTVATNDVDVDDASALLTWSLVDGGTAALNGVLVLDSAGALSFTPTLDFVGTVSFIYRVCDPAGLCDDATGTIVVGGTNDAPVVVDDAFTLPEDGSLANTVAANDNDPDGDALTFSLISGGSAAASGTLVFNTDGSFTYTPTADRNGTVSFVYQACDPGPVCDAAQVTIVIDPVNDAPVANDDPFTMNEDGSIAVSVADNDGDVDALPGTLNWALVDGGTAAASGTLSFQADGSFSYTPNADLNGTVSFTYSLCDLEGSCDQATATITITPQNDAPIARDDGFTMDEDASLSSTIAANDTDVDHTPAQCMWSLLSGGTATANGSLSLTADGSFTYAPNADFNGTVSFTYRLCDAASACDSALVMIMVTPLNDAPNAVDDGFTMDEDAVLGSSIAGNDLDVDGDPLLFSLQDGGSAAANGALSLLADGSFTYVPDADMHGTVSFLYQACDGSGSCDQATVTITVLPVNDPPIADDEVYTMNEDAVLDADVSVNDYDVDGDALSWVLVDAGTAGANGVLVFHPDGTFHFQPAADFNGVVVFSYQACDPVGACAPAQTTVTVLPVNDPPVAGDDLFRMNEDAVLTSSVASNDHDVDHTTLQLAWQLVDGGTALANGVLDFHVDGGFIYTPLPDFHGTVGFSYTVCDLDGACDTASVSIAVDATDDAPKAMDDGFDMNEDAVLNASVTGNDSDVDGDALTWGLVSGSTAAAHGTLGLNTDGTFIYIPNANFNGTVDFSYAACDPSGMCDTAVVTITVHPMNDSPVVGDDVFDMNEDGVLNASVSGNDSDVDGDALTWSLVSGSTAAAHGTLGLNADGSFSYTPSANFNGTVNFRYAACDPSGVCDTAIVTITVHPVNDSPVAVDDGFEMNEDAVLNASVAEDDSDVDGDVLTWSLMSGGTAAASGMLQVNADGTFAYTPNVDFNGTVSFNYVACDPSGLCDTAVVTITVHPMNDGPVAMDDAFDMNADGMLNASVAGNDSEVDGDALTWSLVSGGTAAANGTLSLNVDGSFGYTPNEDFNGTVGFSYAACDPGGVCDTAAVTITVHPVNDGPVAVDDAFDMNEDAVLNESVAGNDSDVDSDALTWSLVSGGTAAANGTLGLNADGSFSYTPNANFNGTVSFNYVACDPSGLCDTAVVTITVHPMNDGPVAMDDAFDMNEDGMLNASVAGSDSDVDGDVLTWSLVSGGTAAAHGTLGLNADGTFTYMPNADFNGVVGFNYAVCDPSGVCDTAAVTITVHPVNDSPVAVDDGFEMNEDAVLNASVAEDDSDVDGDALTWSLVSGGTAAINGTLQLNTDGTFSYTPNADFNGVVVFSYAACDPGSVCDTAVVMIVIHPVNDGPIAVDDTASTPQGVPVTIDVLANDSDPDGVVLVVESAAAQHGDVVIHSDGTLTYLPDAGWCGMDTIAYTACDPGPLCDGALVLVDVQCGPPVNEPPIAVDDTASIPQGVPVTIDVLANDSDPEGDALTVSNAWALHGEVIINADGTLTYRPEADQCGAEILTYAVCDPAPLCDEAVVVVTITCDQPGLIIPQGFSPNGDGVGDTWTIKGLADYPAASMAIINRWGSEVVRASPYANDWDGRSRQGLLPAGTYWYVLDLGTSTIGPLSGYVYLNR